MVSKSHVKRGEHLLLEKLQSPESSGRLKAVRCIRDQVIGNRSRKLAYLKLGVVERLVELLSDPDGESLIRINCAATVGSLAYGIEDGLRAVLASGGVAQLIQLLSSLEERVVEAGVRALKMVVAHQVGLTSLLCPSTLLLHLHPTLYLVMWSFSRVLVSSGHGCTLWHSLYRELFCMP